jgi:DNA replication and repair protein RecF
VRVCDLELRDFRNYERADVGLSDGLTVVHGPIGAGKTNLLEAVFLSCTGHACRRAADRDLVRFGERTARLVGRTAGGERERTIEIGIEPGRPKVFRVDGVRVERGLDEDGRPLACVFLPDRLELVKGAAAGRRAHLDAFVAAVWPTRRATRSAYVHALAQRNALLARIRSGRSQASALAAWNRELAAHGLALMGDRLDAIAGLAPDFGAYGAQLGLAGEASLAYQPRSKAGSSAELEAELEDRLENDLERGFTTHGPHRDEVRLALDGREVRRFASQGQQRIALLALLLAERRALERARGTVPVLLLDDVLSELDRDRRTALVDAVAGVGQTLLTTADPEAARTCAPEANFLEVAEAALVA